MTVLPPDPALSRFVKPTVDTPFHIDYQWWEKQGLDLNVQLQAHLCAEHREAFQGQRVGDKIDWIDLETCEVKQVDGLQYIISTHCSNVPGYIMQAPTLVEAVFRVFLSNGNRPMTPKALAPLVGQRPEQILNVLSGHSARRGLRPVLGR